MEKRTRLVIKLLRSWMILIILPIAAMLLVNWKVTELMNQETYEKHLLALQSSVDSIEDTIYNMNNVAYYFSRNDIINRFLELDPVEYGDRNVEDIRQAQMELKNYSVSNSLLRNMQIYSYKGDMIVDTTTGGTSLERYYGHHFSIEGYTLEQWKEQFLSVSVDNLVYSQEQLRFNSIEEECIIFTMNLPVNSGRYGSGKLLVYMGKDNILPFYDRIHYEDGGFIAILDDNRRDILNDGETADVVVEQDTEEKSGYQIVPVNGEKMFVTYLKGELMEWTYLVGIPLKQVHAETTEMQRFILGVMVFTVLLGICLTLKYTLRTSKDILTVYDTLQKANPDFVYADLEAELKKLIAEDAEMKESVEKQRSLQEISILYNLFWGNIKDGKEIKENLSRLRLDITANYYAILILAINELNEDGGLEQVSIYKAMVKKILKQNIPNLKEVCDISIDRVAVLITSRKKNYVDFMEQLEQQAGGIREQLSRKIKIDVSFSGNIAELPENIPGAFYEACQAIEYEDKDTGYAIQWYKKAHIIDSDSFDYPLETEKKIVDAVKDGDINSLESARMEVQKKNRYILRWNSKEAIFRLQEELSGTIRRILNEESENALIYKNEIEELIKVLEERNDVQKAWDSIWALLQRMTMSNYDKNRHSSLALIKRIKSYIDENYSKTDMSLTTVADEFHITEVYVSKLFKQESGENFSKYVEKLRLEKANEYLAEGNRRIAEIAALVGYGSVQAFRRAYKRVYGIAPSDFERTEK